MKRIPLWEWALAEWMTACFAIDAFDEHETPLSKHRADAEMHLAEKRMPSVALPGALVRVRGGRRTSNDLALHWV